MIEIQQTPLDGLIVIKPRVFRDARGYFMQSFHADDYANAGIADNFVQDNEAQSMAGVLRGLHYQVGDAAQSKLVRVISGAVFDVAVDIRPGSSTYGQWYGTVLSSENSLQMYVPTGFAHGYLCLQDETIFAYKCGAIYSPENEGGIRYDDPTLGIDWPIADLQISLSEKDQALPHFGDHKWI